MSLLFYILFSFLLGYTAVLFWLAIGFLRTSFFVNTNNHVSTPLTIIICARNEEQHIAACLNTIIKQDYDFSIVQLILINDASSDHTVKIAETILKKSDVAYQIISNKKQKGKKESISYAITLARHELILMRDADTFTTSFQWLQTISDFYQNTRSDFIIAPIALADQNVLLWALQAIENNILAVIACGSSHYKKAFLCSGANLIFTKKIFNAAKGYTSNSQYASGDDVFLLEDVKKIANVNINYLKSNAALVYTYPEYTFSALLKQKVRWASKFKLNKNNLNFTVAILIFIVNAAWAFCFIESLFGTFYQSLAFKFVILKVSVDILLLFLALRFIKNKNLLWFSLPAACIYPLYSCIVGLASLFVKPTWKK